MLSLEKAMEIMYIRLEFIENGTLSDMEEKPLGIRFVEFYGCPMGTGSLADCGTQWTRVSTNSTAYRHIGYCIHLHCMYIVCIFYRYDYNMKIFYFCDISPKTNAMQCYKYKADTRKVRYIIPYI